MNVIITGGAGFIGSNIVEFLLKREEVSKVTVFDNLSTGFERNIQPFFHHPRFNFINGDITRREDCRQAFAGADAVCHQAALGSVPRSILNPLASHDANVTGFLNALEAAREHGIRRFVYASSSSVYGDSKVSPKKETDEGNVMSPYAATKKADELYANVFHKTYGMEVVGLRYFNVFGPRQDPGGAYAAVIPLFFKGALTNQSPIINGDGSITRDFTYIENVVQINWNALTTTNPESFGQAYNVACGQTTTLTQLWQAIKTISGSAVEAKYGEPRKGDILQSLADISKARNLLNYDPKVGLEEGLRKSLEWYKGLDMKN
jgi:UDP-N-acetylglucosamine 4-epimerase